MQELVKAAESAAVPKYTGKKHKFKTNTRLRELQSQRQQINHHLNHPHIRQVDKISMEKQLEEINKEAFETINQEETEKEKTAIKKHS